MIHFDSTVRVCELIKNMETTLMNKLNTLQLDLEKFKQQQQENNPPQPGSGLSTPGIY